MHSQRTAPSTGRRIPETSSDKSGILVADAAPPTVLSTLIVSLLPASLI
jgi:hypothetical protein